MTFLQHSKPDLQSISAPYLQQLQQAKSQELLQEPLSLVEESGNYWYDLAMGYTRFDRKQQLADAINAITIEEWRGFVKQLFDEPRSRMLLLSTPGKTAVPGFILKEKDQVMGKEAYQFNH